MDECSLPQQLNIGRWEDNWSEKEPSQPIVSIAIFHMSEKLNMAFKAYYSLSLRLRHWCIMHILTVVSNVI
jgi:hypothetical protein